MALGTLMLVAVKAFLIALFLTPICRDIFRAYNVVDRPGRRKVHAYPIPRVGGIPIAAGYLFALMQLPEPAMGHVWALLPGAATIFLTGLIDDFFDLKPLVKLSGQVGAALLVYANGIRLDAVGGLDLPPWISLPLTVFWILLATNALNLIDGLDGLCSGMGLFAAIALTVAGMVQGHPALSFVALPLAGALTGFLFFNINPATVFLGDSGALTIGFLLGAFGIIWTEQSTTLASSLVPLLALAIPLLDVLISIVRRFLKNHPLFGADRGHTHHRLLDRGLSVRQSASALYGVAALGSVFAALLAWQPRAGGYHGIVLGGFCLACGVGIRELRYPEFEAAKALLLGEYRKNVAIKARLIHLREMLDGAPDIDQWWRLVLRAAREEGFARVVWNGGEDFSAGHGSGVARERSVGDTDRSDAAWTFSVPLADGSCLEIYGKAGGSHQDLIAYAEVLQETFDGVRPRAAQTVVR